MHVPVLPLRDMYYKYNVPFCFCLQALYTRTTMERCSIELCITDHTAGLNLHTALTVINYEVSTVYHIPVFCTPLL